MKKLIIFIIIFGGMIFMDVSKIKIENEILTIKDITARNEIELLKIRKHKSFDGKVCFFGDSYGAMEYNWIDYLQELLEISNDDVLLKFAQGGSGFIGRGGAIPWPTRLQTLIDNSIEEDRNKVSAIIVAGGFNDRAYNETNLYGAMSDFNTLVTTYFPNATVYLAMIGWTMDNTTEDLGVQGGFMFNLQSVLPIYSKCVNLGWKFLENCQYVMHDLSFFYDEAIKVHPNQDGSLAIAGSMFSAINGNCGIHKPWIDLINTSWASNIGGIVGTPQLKLDNGKITMFTCSGTDYFDVGFTSVQNFTANTFYPFFNIINGYGVSDRYRPIIKSVNMAYKDDNDDLVMFNGQFAIKNGQIGFIPEEDIESNYIRTFKCLIEFDAMMF